MYEISLVPDVKSELLLKQKLRNLIILICIIVAASCAAVILILIGIMGGQNLTISSQENEIKCRTDGSGTKCGEYGTSIMSFRNVNELLTIQDQMKSIGVLNKNKIKFSRVFGLLDVILPNNPKSGDVVKLHELTRALSRKMLTFGAVGEAYNNIGYHALEAFVKSTEKTYFDYGSYMRKDENDEYVEIPSYCITEKVDNGYVYGIYHKGNPGCEAPMVEEDKKSQDSSDEEKEESSDKEAEKKDDEEKVAKVEKKDITIRRTYKDSDDREEYKNGNDSLAKKGEEGNTGKYYFESECIEYDENGKFSEDLTLEACPILAEGGLQTGNSSFGRGAEDKMVLSFSVNMTLDKRVLSSSSKHMRIIGPSRQNVTDSYVQVRDMFTEKAKKVEDEVK